MKKTKGQISVEYLVIVGFITFIVIGILGIGLVYSESIKDRIKISQMSNYANKVISTSESVFYSGEPSKSTISVYLPEGIKEIEIIENNLIISIQTSSGITKTSFSSNVPISGTLSTSFGIKKIQIVAEEDMAVISPA